MENATMTKKSCNRQEACLREPAARPAGNTPPGVSDRRVLFIGLFLLSFSLLGLEVAYTRLLSVTLSYHFLFLVLSLAMLGLGLGAVSACFLRRPTALFDQYSGLGRLAGIFSLTATLPVLSALFFSAGVPVLTGLVFVPFYFGGLFLAEAFRSFAPLSNRMYAADLIGAGTGAGGSVLVMDLFGGPGAVLVLGLVLAGVSLLFLS